jgi:glutathione transport system ATP-binding protein
MEIGNLLEVNDLSVYFDSDDDVIKAVDGISFKIKQGETLALVGESGSGKSVSAMSLMRLNEIINGYIASGSINFSLSNNETVDIVSLKDSRLQKIRGNEISMIFQEPMTSLNPVLTIGKQISESIELHQKLNKEDARKKTVEMLKLVRIPEPEKQYNQYPHHFSGGMRQRVMIAMALSCRPKLLIADEPTTALDVTIQSQILSLIKNLQNQLGMAILFITHDMGVVAEVADRVIVMLNGKIVEEGIPKQIFHSPVKEYTKNLINSVPKLGSMRGKSNPEKFYNI